MTNPAYLIEDLPTMIAGLEEDLRHGLAADTAHLFDSAADEAGIEIRHGRVTMTDAFDFDAFAALIEAVG